MEPQQTIAVIDYGLGNVKAIVNMLHKIGVRSFSARDPSALRQADKLILPGVGSFDAGMENLEHFGFLPVLNELVLQAKVPILGICLGMQLFSECSEEGRRPGLGWIAGKTVRFRFDQEHRLLRIPHMGWNQIQVRRPGPLPTDPSTERWFYFAHSYYVECREPLDRLAETSYGLEFASMIGHDNVLGVQFHPEKSHRYGMELFRGWSAARAIAAAKAA